MNEGTYRRLTLGETVNILCEKKDTLILCHSRPDCDTIGSGIALKKLLEKMGMKAHCICESELPHRLEFLPSGQDSFLPENIPADFSAERIISVDTASPMQLGKLEDAYLDRVELMIDHHGKGEQYADGYILPDISATGEIIFNISRELLRIGAIDSISAEIDTCIYAAISSDTGCFKYSSVSPDTHMIAAELLRTGINASDINHRLFDCKPFIQLKTEQLGFEHLTLYDNGRIAIIEFPYELKASNGILDQHMETLVDIARSVEGVGVAVVIRQPKDEGVYRCSMRSSCEIDVSKVCSKLGGGGHIKAAGCTIEADSIAAVREIVLKTIREEY
ncbi:MAG: bifunctional oligoribonuclease/PAP phosphatase NrnA [Clostridia bacterium]|nr:bifunctional oligoribonuclease/PAP phosphatase NrnA [Clostridia bacterium]